MGTFKYCLCFTRKFSWGEAPAPPADVKAVFARYSAATSGGTAVMTIDDFRRFLSDEHGAVADVDRIIEKVRQLGQRRQPLGFVGKPTLSVEDFYQFLFSDELNPPLRSEVHQDMTAPMSHYYIYTGHNSYLTGNQLSSDCSDVPIIKALERGARVIELDIWPNSTKDGVDVLHGRTLTSPVELIKCLKSIKEYAFSASPYPVVITLEDHLTTDLQAKVAKMVTEIFGDMLYYPDSDSHKEFPSPEALKNRVILSTKPPKEYLEAQNTKGKDGDSKLSVDTDDEETWGKEVPDLQAELGCEINCAESIRDEDDLDEDEDDEDDDDQKVRHNLHPEYKQLITIRAGKPKGHITEALKVEPDKVRRLSLSEPQLAKTAASYGAEIIRFTQKNILRVYPKGTRFNSSNYNPFIGWVHGAQMVAFNMQGYGRSLWLMHGFFKANGGAGYIKKPEFLMKAGPNNEVFDPKTTLAVKLTLKVKVYMGDGWRIDFDQTHFDPLSPPDFYARVGIAGVPADVIMMKTKAIEDSWIPVWDEEFTFPLTVPELALLRIEVHEYDMSGKDDFGGQNCLPVSELKPGIRAVPLFDQKGIKLKSVKLLMRFEFV